MDTTWVSDDEHTGGHFKTSWIKYGGYKYKTTKCCETHHKPALTSDLDPEFLVRPDVVLHVGNADGHLRTSLRAARVHVNVADF